MRRVWIVILMMCIAFGLMSTPVSAQASSDYDDIVVVTPELYVFTDGGNKSQALDISTTWWPEFKETYALRLQQGLNWPSNLVSAFEDILETGSWGVYQTETPSGVLVSFLVLMTLMRAAISMVCQNLDG